MTASSTRLNTSAHAIVVPLKVGPALLGLKAPTLTLQSEDGSIKLSLPMPYTAAVGPKCSPGDTLIVSMTFMLNTVESVEPFEGMLLKGMDS